MTTRLQCMCGQEIRGKSAGKEEGGKGKYIWGKRGRIAEKKVTFRTGHYIGKKGISRRGLKTKRNNRNEGTGIQRRLQGKALAGRENRLFMRLLPPKYTKRSMEKSLKANAGVRGCLGS